MANDKFINLEELSTTTQALLSKINEQANLKVNKNNIIPKLTEGTEIASIEGIKLYTPEAITLQDVANRVISYQDLSGTPTIPNVVSTYSSTGTDAVNGKAVANAISSTYSSTSTKAMNGIAVASAITSTYSSTGTLAVNGQAVASALSTIHDTLVVTITSGYSTSDQEYWYNASQSMANIKAAYNAGKTCYAKYQDRIYYLFTIYSSSVIFIHYRSVSSSGYLVAELLSITASGPSAPQTYCFPIISNSNASSGQILQYNSTSKYWQPTTHTLANITDVTISSPAEGQLLKYDATNSKWINSANITLPSSSGTLALTSDITTAIGNVNSFDVEVVNSLPSSNIKTHTIYFVSSTSATNNVYDEYMYINSAWEKIGNTAVDLTGYVQESQLAAVAATGSYNSLTDKPTIPTVTSTYSSTGTDAVNGTAVASALETLNFVPVLNNDLLVSNDGGNGNGFIVEYMENSLIQASWNGVSIHQLNNPTTATDAANKSYVDSAISAIVHPVISVNGATGVVTLTASNVGALPSSTTYVSSFNGQAGAVNVTIPAAQVQADWNATTGMAAILNKPSIPAAVSVSNTLSSGTLIATINGTNIYAPSYIDADGVSY